MREEGAGRGHIALTPQANRLSFCSSSGYGTILRTHTLHRLRHDDDAGCDLSPIIIRVRHDGDQTPEWFTYARYSLNRADWGYLAAGILHRASESFVVVSPLGMELPC